MKPAHATSFIVDSCGWIEYLSGGPKAGKYEIYLSHPERVVVPTLVLFEVYRKIKKVRDEEDALLIATQMQKGRVIAVDPGLALTAADLSLKHGLAMADAFIYATVIVTQSTLVTSDNDFRKLPRVIVI